jgi:hypothetical protein
VEYAIYTLSATQLIVAAVVTLFLAISKAKDNALAKAIQSDTDTRMLELVAEYGEGIKTTEAYQAYVATRN